MTSPDIKDKYCVIQAWGGPGRAIIGSRWWFYRAELVFMGTDFQFGKMKAFSIVMVVLAAQQCMPLTPLNCALMYD